MEGIHHPADVLRLVSRPIVEAAKAAVHSTQIDSWLGTKMTEITQNDSLDNFLMNTGFYVFLDVAVGLTTGIILPVWVIFNNFTVSLGESLVDNIIYGNYKSWMIYLLCTIIGFWRYMDNEFFDKMYEPGFWEDMMAGDAGAY